MLTIKPFTPNDYQALADIENAVFTDEFFAAQSLEEADQRTPSHIKNGRFMAWLNGQVVGFSHFTQDVWQYHPQRFRLWVVVRPEFQRQGIGSTLWETVYQATQMFNPIGFSANAREDKFGIEFLRKRGLLEKMRTWENRISVLDFDVTPYTGLQADFERQSIQIVSAEQLKNTHTDFAKRYYDLNTETGRDVPRAYPATDRTFEEWSAWNLETPKVLLAGTFIELQGQDYVGMSQLFKSDGDYLTIGLTGVRREARGQHIALALKVACIIWAKENNYPEIRTWNDSNNTPILALNTKLGFVQCPAWIDCIKELQGENR